MVPTEHIQNTSETNHLEEPSSSEGDSEEGVQLSKGLLEEVLCRNLGTSREDLKLEEATNISLDRLNIEVVLPEVAVELNKVTNLYIQKNLLESSAFCTSLHSLRFLCIANNRLEALEGLGDLPNLRVLDASHNDISTVVVKRDLPASIMFLNLEGNPCVEAICIFELIQDLKSLPKLVEGDNRSHQSTLVDDTSVNLENLSLDTRAKQLEKEISDDIDREIRLEQAKLKTREDGALNDEVSRIKNSISSPDAVKTSQDYNYRSAMDGLMHHARTQMANKVDAMRERCRIRRLNVQEYADSVSSQIGDFKSKMREKPFRFSGAHSRPGTAKQDTKE